MTGVPTYAVVLVAAVAAAVIAIDIALALNNRKGDTYSEVIRAWGRKRIAVVILISFAMGLLAGHWWWSPDCAEVCK